MASERRWYEFTRVNLDKIPEGELGVYLIADKNKKAIYAGSSASENVGVRGRLISHFINKKFPKAKYFKFAFADTPEEAREMERDTFQNHIRKSPQIAKHTKRIPREIDDSILSW